MINSTNLWYVILFLFSVLISSISQVLLRKSALRAYKSRLEEYINPLVIGAYIIFLGATLLTMIAYRVIPLSWGPIFEASGYIFIGILSFLFLDERISHQKLLGMTLIISGMVVYSL